jgi:DNA topoisomerase IA
MKKEIKKVTEKYVTETTFKKFESSFETNMTNIAKSFERHEKVMDHILKELQQMHEENKYFRQSISGLNSDGLSYDRRIDNLDLRVEKPEAKM